jgi:NTP pyrophosphatase (non-canonical NTP hydrolase)
VLRKLQLEHVAWATYNFGPRNPIHAALGVGEEAGELQHCVLKMAQGIRTNEDLIAKAKDAVADIIIYLADYCNGMGFDMEETVQETWEQVKKRDWKKYPETGMPPKKVFWPDTLPPELCQCA